MASAGDELINPVTGLRADIDFETLAGLARLLGLRSEYPYRQETARRSFK